MGFAALTSKSARPPYLLVLLNLLWAKIMTIVARTLMELIRYFLVFFYFREISGKTVSSPNIEEQSLRAVSL